MAVSTCFTVVFISHTGGSVITGVCWAIAESDVYFLIILVYALRVLWSNQCVAFHFSCLDHFSFLISLLRSSFHFKNSRNATLIFVGGSCFALYNQNCVKTAVHQSSLPSTSISGHDDSSCLFGYRQQCTVNWHFPEPKPWCYQMRKPSLCGMLGAL